MSKLKILFNFIPEHIYYINLIVNTARGVFLHLWVPAFIGVTSFVVFSAGFSIFDQTLEIYQSWIDNGKKDIFQASFGITTVFILSLSVWSSGRSLSYRYEYYKDYPGSGMNPIFKKWLQDINVGKRMPEDASTPHPSFCSSICHKLNPTKEPIDKVVKYQLLLNLPRFFGLLPALGLMVGIFKINNFTHPEKFAILYLFFCTLSLVLLIFFFRFRFDVFSSAINMLKPREGTTSFTTRTIDSSLFGVLTENLVVNIALFWFAAFTVPVVSSVSGENSLGVIMVFVICLLSNLLLCWWSGKYLSPIFLFVLNIIAALFLLKTSPLFWADSLGSVSITAISLSSMTIFLSTIYNWGRNIAFPSWMTSTKNSYRRFNAPAIAILLVVAFTASWFNWNDNHQIRSLKSIDETKNTVSMSLEESFKTWFVNRKDLDLFKQNGLKEYPVYIVSAQGGGIYAAYHSATTLAKLHDTIPNFSEHVFTVSGVSGGSIGSSIYASLVKVIPQKSTKSALTSSSKLSIKTICLRCFHWDYFQICFKDFCLGLSMIGTEQMDWKLLWKIPGTKPLKQKVL
jgi:hypothetical protein